MMWAWLNKMVWYRCYVSVLRTMFMGFKCSFLTAYTRCSLRPTVFYLDYVLGLRSFSLLVFVWCPQLLQNRRYSSNTIDHWRNPAHQVNALRTSRSLDWFGWFLCILYWKVLAIQWSLSIVCGLLATGDKRRWVKLLTRDSDNCWISNHRTENCVERNGDFRSKPRLLYEHGT